MLGIPTYRLLDGTVRQHEPPDPREDAWGDEDERQEREDREREKSE